MSLFSNMTTNGLEEQRDTLGGFSLLDSNIYPAVIKAAYAGRSQSGAMSVTLHLDIEGKEYKETVYITNKNGENFFIDKSDPKKRRAIPGFSVINDLCLVTLNKSLNQMDTENKVLNIYNPELGKEVATSVPVIMELLNKKAEFAIVKEKRFKTQKTDTGYVETDEIRESNVISKVFNAESHQTAYEIAHDLTEAPLFCDKWLEKNKGVTVDRTKGKNALSHNPIPAPAKTERKSLFA